MKTGLGGGSIKEEGGRRVLLAAVTAEAERCSMREGNRCLCLSW